MVVKLHVAWSLSIAAGGWHFYIATVQTDEADLICRCALRFTWGLLCTNLGRENEASIMEAILNIALIHKYLSYFNMADHLMNNSIVKNDAAAYDHSLPGANDWLHIGTWSVSSRNCRSFLIAVYAWEPFLVFFFIDNWRKFDLKPFLDRFHLNKDQSLTRHISNP